MNKPRTEITNDSAKFVLHAYRPNGADAQDPAFRAALEQAARDPELAAWFKEQRSFDSFIVAKLAEFEPPATLYSAILAGIANRSSARQFRIRPLLALAAVLFFSGAILIPLMMERGPGSKMIEQFQRENLTMLNSTPDPELDLVTADFSHTQQYLAEKNVPSLPFLPERLRNLPTAGCKTLDWKGHEFSLTCFRLPSGELLHLFVIDDKAFQAINVGDQFKEMNGWHFKCERISGMLAMFVSRAPMAEIRKYL